MSNDIVIIDVETTVYNQGENAIGTNPASPWTPNEIVMTGFKHLLDTTVHIVSGASPRFSFNKLVGHNIKFDIHHLYKSFGWQILVREPNISIWDTQLAEYILTGQEAQYATLDSLAVKYGGTLKDDRIKEYWKAGVMTEDIPKEQLEEYLKHDVLNTELVFRAQVKEAEKKGMLELLYVQMYALLATIEMEYNGMAFNTHRAKSIATGLIKERASYHDAIVDTMETHGIESPNPASNDHVSLLLFGGTQMVDGTKQILNEDGTLAVYKTGLRKGLIKTKKCKVPKTIVGLGLVPDADTEQKKKGFYKVGDDVLKNKQFHPAVTGIIHYRALNKEIETYLLGYSKLCFPDHHYNVSMLHPSLNHVSTATGRLSCTKPNLQNVSGKGED